MSGWWSGHKVVDPSVIESRYSTEDGLGFMSAIFSEETSEEGLVKMERVRAVMGQIPPREADFIDLYYFRSIKQTDIAAIFNVSQPTVCYRLKRAATRILFLLSLPDTDLDEVKEAASQVIDDPLDIQILVLMVETTCQSEVGKRLNVSQGLVRHRFIRSVDKMRGVEGLEKFVAMFDLIAENLNILREVQRPTWGTKVARVLL